MVYKVVLSKPRKTSFHKRIEVLRNGRLLQASFFDEKKVFHKNMGSEELESFVEQNLEKNFMQVNAWDDEFEYQTAVSKKGKKFSTRKKVSNPPKKITFGSGFDIQKNHILKEGDKIQALVDLGIFTKDYKVTAGKRDKFVQINRFLEIINDALDSPEKKTNIIDFGCGKSYLTFLIHHFFTEVLGREAETCGLDENFETIKKCEEIAKKGGYKNLRFRVGDIGSLEALPIADYGRANFLSIAICLHACDLATDYAILKAINWNSDLIFVVPCCQHELSKQVRPKNFNVLAEYGIIRERFASLATDVIRAKFLEYMGYGVGLLDFTEKVYTDKNLMIRAKKTGNRNLRALEEIKTLCDEFGFTPKILESL